MTGIAPFVPQTFLGAHDDGSSEGVARVKLAQGELVKVGVASGLNSPATSLSTVVGGASITFQPYSQLANADQTNADAWFSVPAWTSGTQIGATLSRIIYGRAIGVRFLRNAATPAFCVEIDGVVYLVNQALAYDDVPPSSVDGEAFFLVADDLPDGPHTVRIILTADPAIPTTQNLFVYGFLAERRAGYSEKSKSQDFGGVGAVPTSSAAISLTGEVQIRAVFYANTTASAILVTVTRAGTTIWCASVPGNGTAVCDFLDLTALSANHVAASAGVNYAILGKNF